MSFFENLFAKKSRMRPRCQTRRSLRLEPMENRRLLAVTYDSGTGDIDIDGGSGADTYTIRVDPSDSSRIEIIENGSSTTGALSTFDGNLTIDTNGGNDVVKFDYANGNPLAEFALITFDGGMGTDRIEGNNLGFNASGNGTTLSISPSAGVSDGVVTSNVEDATLRGTSANNNFDMSGWTPGGVKLYGNSGADTLSGSDSADTIYGGSGNDFIEGEEGGDLLHGDGGNDTIYGGDGNDLAYGGYGSDRVFGEAGNDELSATYLGASSSSDGDFDLLDGGAGTDSATFDAVEDTFIS